VLQQTRMSDNSEMLDAKEAPLAAVTDDSHIAQYTEIDPPERASVNFHEPEFIELVVEVEPDDLQDVQQEPADENDSVSADYSVKVRFR